MPTIHRSPCTQNHGDSQLTTELILYRTHHDCDDSPNSEHDIHHNNYLATSDFDMLQRVSLEVTMYTVYAELSQRPRVLMRDSGNPCNSAVVAAPILEAMAGVP